MGICSSEVRKLVVSAMKINRTALGIQFHTAYIKYLMKTCTATIANLGIENYSKHQAIVGVLT